MAVGATWVFDVDGCIIDSLTGSSLRPGVTAVLEHLRASACTILLWSAGGAGYARRRADEQQVGEFFDAFHDKDRRDENGRYETTPFLASHDDVVFVDDRPEDVPLEAEVVAVRPYLFDNPHDCGLAPVARRAGLVPVEAGFHPGGF